MKKTLNYYKPYTWLIILTLFFIIIQSFSELLLPNSVKNIIDVGVANKDNSFVLNQGLIMIFLVIGIAISTIAVGYFSSKVSSLVARDLRREVFAKVEQFSLKEFDKFGTSSLITRTNNDIIQIQTVSAIILRIAVMSPIMCIGGVFMAFSTNSSLANYVLLAMPVVVITILLVAKSAIPKFTLIQKKIDNVNQITRENLTGLRVVKAFIKTDYEIDRFDKANSNLTDLNIKANRIMGSLMPLLMIIMNSVIVVIMWFGSDIVASGNLEVGSLVAFTQYVMQIMFSLVMLSMAFVMLPRAMVSSKRIMEVLNTNTDIIDGDKDIDNSCNGVIEFKDVSFSYPNSQEPVLENVSFSAVPGQTTAFIGSTGSGKSTLINLIPRFYDVSQGSIMIDGVDIKNYSQNKLRDIMGFVPQKGLLFSGTIEENLCYGNNNATKDDLIEAATTAQALEFIMSKEKQFDEHIAQGGGNVSGGQKQRLSIARALMKKPKIYIFDDSFSALDYKTDSNLRKALKSQTTNSTVLIVAQRVSTIMYADKIVVLDEGKVVGIGKHKELISSCPVYREIVESQLSKEEM